MVIVGIGPLKVTAGEGITDQKSGQPGASAVTRRIRAVSRKAPEDFDMGRGGRGQLVSNYRLCKEGPTEVAGFGSPGTHPGRGRHGRHPLSAYRCLPGTIKLVFCRMPGRGGPYCYMIQGMLADMLSLNG